MKTVRVKFADYYGKDPAGTWAYRILCSFYDVELVDRSPDYLIDGGLGTDHLDYPDAVKIVFIGESCCPDFNLFDYAVGFDDLSFGDRYLRVPLYAFYESFKGLCGRSGVAADPSALLRRGFCSFVVSNADGDPMRVEFFRRLSRYKPVASGGRLFNNVGGPVADKYDFISKYKFNIAFENSVVPGYTTEKVMEPLSVGSVPIYYGNPRIEDDFNPGCMVRVASRDDVERAVEEVVALDRDDDAYLAKTAAPTFVHPFEWHERRLTEFLRGIFDRPLDEARRLNDYGYQTNLRRRAAKARNLYDLTHPGRMLKRIKHALQFN